MKYAIAIALAAALLFGSVGCANKTTGGPPPPPPTNTLQSEARDVAAALKGALKSAQTQYQSSCTANPKQSACVAINKAVGVQNVLITADQAYCGWSATVQPSDPNATCVPVQGAVGALNAAIANAATAISEIQGLVQ